jgi:hypothetical protein
MANVGGAFVDFGHSRLGHGRPPQLTHAWMVAHCCASCWLLAEVLEPRIPASHPQFPAYMQLADAARGLEQHIAGLGYADSEEPSGLGL